MILKDAIEILEGAIECNKNQIRCCCDDDDCANCNLYYKQGTWGEFVKALEVAVANMRKNPILSCSACNDNYYAMLYSNGELFVFDAETGKRVLHSYHSAITSQKELQKFIDEDIILILKEIEGEGM